MTQDNSFDNFIKEKLESYPSQVPSGLWDKIVNEKDKLFDNFIADKLESYPSQVPGGLWDKIVNEKDKLFDNFIADKLENYSSPVPAGLWEKIIDEKDRKPVAFWWTKAGVLGAIGLIALLAGGYFILKNKKDAPTVTINQPAAPEQTTGSNTTTANSDNNKQNNGTTPGGSTANDHSATNTPATVNATVTPNNNTPAQNNNTVAPNNARSNNAAPFINQNNGATGNNSSLRNQLPSRQGKTSRTELVSNNDPKGKLPLMNPRTLFTPDIPQNTEPNKDELVITEQSELLMKPFGPLDFARLSSPGFNLNHPLTSPFDLRDISKLTTCSDCPSARGPVRDDWYVEVYGSPDFTSKTVTPTGITNAYLQKKDSSESMSGGFTAGFRISRNIGDHFMFKTGLQYAQLDEKFSNRTENERKTTTVIVTRTIVRPQGDTTISDTTSVTQIGYRTRTAVNHYRNLEIPVIMGYEFGKRDDQWQVAINGGVIINALSWSSGETLDTTYNVVPINTKGSSITYKHDVGLSLYGSVSILRKISKTVDVFAEPYYRYGLSSVSSDQGFTQRFNAGGLTLGVRVKINNRKSNGFGH